MAEEPPMNEPGDHRRSAFLQTTLNRVIRTQSASQPKSAVVGGLMVAEGVALLGVAFFWGTVLTQPIMIEARRGGPVTVSRPTLLGVETRTLAWAEARPAVRLVGRGKGRTEASFIGELQLDPLGLQDRSFAMKAFLGRYQAFYDGAGDSLALELPAVDLMRPAALAIGGAGAAALVAGLVKGWFPPPFAPAPLAPVPPGVPPTVAARARAAPSSPADRRRSEARQLLWWSRILMASGCLLVAMAWWGATIGVTPTTLVAHRGADGRGTVTLTRPTIWGVRTDTMTLLEAGRAHEDPAARGESAVVLGAGMPLNPFGLVEPPGALYDIEKRYNAFYASRQRPADFRAATARLEVVERYAWVWLVAGGLGLVMGTLNAWKARVRLEQGR